MFPPHPRPVAGDAERDALAAWAASGAMALTGRADGPPLGPPDRLVPGLQRFAAIVRDRSARLGREVSLDPVALLGERAAIAGLRRRGTTSCGGATRLVRAGDGGWLAVSLPRPADRELLPAWLGIDDPPDDPDRPAAASGAPDPADAGPSDELWAAVADAVGRRPAADVAQRAWLLGLPVSVPPTREPAPPPAAPGPLAPLAVRATAVPGAAPGPSTLADVVVADLSSVWAGPLCGSLLALAGARVLKVESTGRPDGSRRGPPAFFDLMNGHKQGVALDLTTTSGWTALWRLLADVDVVIEGSRPRALEQHGIVAADLVAGGRPRVWVSVTGHGRAPPGRDRVAFGDDAAVAGGLVAADESGPCFCADAVADPAAGLAAAAACLDALTVGGGWVLDVALADVAAHLAGPTLVPPDGEMPLAAPPRARPVTARGPALGEDGAGRGPTLHAP